MPDVIMSKNESSVENSRFDDLLQADDATTAAIIEQGVACMLPRLAH